MRRVALLLLGLVPLVQPVFAPTLAAAGGWYLMRPPGDRRGKDAPMSKWTQQRAYATVAACEADREADRVLPNRWLGDTPPVDPIDALLWHSLRALSPDDVVAFIAPFDAEQCVATDDPRLKSGSGWHGWYLMIPAHDGRRVLLDEPLGSWPQSAYATAEECQAERIRLYREATQRVEQLHLGPREPWPLSESVFFHARCIASDDPRLK